MVPSLSSEDFDAERFAVALRLADYLFGNVMVMNIDGTHKLSSAFNVLGFFPVFFLLFALCALLFPI